MNDVPSLGEQVMIGDGFYFLCSRGKFVVSIEANCGEKVRNQERSRFAISFKGRDQRTHVA